MRVALVARVSKASPERLLFSRKHSCTLHETHMMSDIT